MEPIDIQRYTLPKDAAQPLIEIWFLSFLLKESLDNLPDPSEREYVRAKSEICGLFVEISNKVQQVKNLETRNERLRSLCNNETEIQRVRKLRNSLAHPKTPLSAELDKEDIFQALQWLVELANEIFAALTIQDKENAYLLAKREIDRQWHEKYGHLIREFRERIKGAVRGYLD